MKLSIILATIGFIFVLAIVPLVSSSATQKIDWENRSSATYLAYYESGMNKSDVVAPIYYYNYSFENTTYGTWYVNQSSIINSTAVWPVYDATPEPTPIPPTPEPTPMTTAEALVQIMMLPFTTMANSIGIVIVVIGIFTGLWIARGIFRNEEPEEQSDDEEDDIEESESSSPEYVVEQLVEQLGISSGDIREYTSATSSHRPAEKMPEVELDDERKVRKYDLDN